MWASTWGEGGVTLGGPQGSSPWLSSARTERKQMFGDFGADLLSTTLQKFVYYHLIHNATLESLGSNLRLHDLVTRDLVYNKRVFHIRYRWLNQSFGDELVSSSILSWPPA